MNVDPDLLTELAAGWRRHAHALDLYAPRLSPGGSWASPVADALTDFVGVWRRDIAAVSAEAGATDDALAVAARRYGITDADAAELLRPAEG